MAETVTQTMVEARALSKSFGATKALDGISFSISRGEVVGFLGPNGAGKTTTMRILTGFLRPSAGQALVAGTEVSDDPLSTRAKIGYLPENAPLYDDMMVADYLKFTAQLRKVPDEKRTARLKEICERCGLNQVLGKDIGQLSKGYRQRVGLAQALVGDPDLLVLDEPTSGLDPNQIVEIRELIKDVGREKTVILSTHILPEVQATCDRIIIINDGRLVADDTPDALTDREAGGLVRVVVKGSNGEEVDPEHVGFLLSNVPGVRAVDSDDGEGQGTLGFVLKTQGAEDPREKLFKTAVENNLVLLDMHREAVSLEDTFRRLTRGDGGANA